MRQSHAKTKFDQELFSIRFSLVYMAVLERSRARYERFAGYFLGDDVANIPALIGRLLY